MKNNVRLLKKVFTDYCENLVYIPTIFKDEFWEYFMETVGRYIGSEKYWEEFIYVFETIYDKNIEKMIEEFDSITNDLKNILLKTPTVEYEPNFLFFTDLPDGKYLTLDLRRAIFQTLLYFNIITVDDINLVLSKYKNWNLLKNYKWILGKAYAKNPKKYHIYGLIKRLIYLSTSNINDPLFKLIHKQQHFIYLVGDRLFVQLNDDIETVFKDFLFKDYTTIDGVTYFVDICVKQTYTINKKLEISVDNSLTSKKRFYNTTLKTQLPFDVYPQIYKFINNIPCEDKDLAFGYDNDISYFTKKIWEV